MQNLTRDEIVSHMVACEKAMSTKNVSTNDLIRLAEENQRQLDILETSKISLSDLTNQQIIDSFNIYKDFLRPLMPKNTTPRLGY